MTKIALIAVLVGMALSAGVVASSASTSSGKSAMAFSQIAGHSERGECRRGGDRDGDGDC